MTGRLRSLTVTAALLLGAACGITDPKPATARLSFQLDTTCAKIVPGSPAFSLIVDDSVIGSAKLAPGQTSPEFAVRAGTHTVAASVPNVAWWAPLSLSMSRNQEVIYLMQCLFPFGTRAAVLSPR